ncbi:MAG: DUF3472 domain-containing protein [Eubacteriales bacterium]|nr:DUF3472 domain-containing protein [Eubacteriales bacterium]
MRRIFAFFMLLAIVLGCAPVFADYKQANYSSRIEILDPIEADIINVDFNISSNTYEGSWSFLNWSYGEAGFSSGKQREVFFKLKSIGKKKATLEWARGEYELESRGSKLFWTKEWRWTSDTWYSLRLQTKYQSKRTYLTLWVARHSSEPGTWKKLAVFSYKGRIPLPKLDSIKHSAYVDSKSELITFIDAINVRQASDRQWKPISRVVLDGTKKFGLPTHRVHSYQDDFQRYLIIACNRDKDERKSAVTAFKQKTEPLDPKFIVEPVTELARSLASFDLHGPQIVLNYQSPYYGSIIQAEWKCTKEERGSYWAPLTWDEGYCGFQKLGDGSRVVIFSLWDLADGTRAEFINTKNTYYHGVFDNEDCGVQMIAKYPWFENKWYTIRVQEWHFNGETYLACWVRSKDQEWFNVGVYKYPKMVNQLGNVGAFIEDFAFHNSAISAKYRNTYMRLLDGQTWLALNHFNVGNQHTISDVYEDPMLLDIPYNFSLSLSKDQSTIKVTTGGEEDINAVNYFNFSNMYFLRQKPEPRYKEWIPMKKLIKKKS